MDAPLVANDGSDWVLFEPTTNTARIVVRIWGTLADGGGVHVIYTGNSAVDEQAGSFMARSSEALFYSPGLETIAGRSYPVLR
jgi:hypothetical protein